MTLLIASNNAHKVREFREIFSGFEVVAPSDLGLRFEHEEVGTTFVENALGKAKTLFEILQTASHGKNQASRFAEIAVLADDSGLVVPALDGAPGVYSARYGAELPGTALDDAGRTALLVDRMRGINDRSAYYVCCMALYLGVERFVTVQETWEGSIAQNISTAGGGFGYDPIFVIAGTNTSVAEIPSADKSRMSHRAKACNRLLRQLRSATLQ